MFAIHLVLDFVEPRIWRMQSIGYKYPLIIFLTRKILATMKKQKLENVRTDNVTNITNWIRGKESLTLLDPRNHPMALLGLGRFFFQPPQLKPEFRRKHWNW